jgi:hypothetical protein
LLRNLELPIVVEYGPQPGISEGEVRIEFDRMLVKGDRGQIISRGVFLIAQSERLQALKRRCGGFFQRLIESLDRGQRLA